MASTDMVRVLVSDHLDAHIGDIDPTQVSELADVAQVNGEHALTIVTTQELEKTNRLLIRDAMGHWHEYVVLGIQSERQEDGALWHEYYCVWSLQYDLSATFVDDMYGCGVVPGHASVPQTARRGLECALEGTTRWAIGSITVTTMAAASFYRRSGWEGLQTVVEKWGGEIRATITVDSSGVASRAVDLLEHEGRAQAVRRFDYGYDVTGIKRTVSDDVWPCRIVPLGASQETEEGGYTRRPSIESVNGGVMWLQDDEAVPLTRVPDGAGGWEYPTLIVKNDTYEEPADLKAWALEHITEYTRPIVSYEATVAQFAQAGMDAHGVELGDEVVVVDRGFGADGLRLEARVLKVKQSLLDPAQTELTIGNLTPTMGGELASIEKQVTDLAQTVENGSAYSGTTAWVQNLLARLNADINATGGFTYITEGQGIRTYDVAVTNPLVGAEAHAVVEVKGGTIRIANTKDSSGQWEWKTVFTSGYVNAEVIRAIGQMSASHVEVDANGVHVYDPDGNEVAMFGQDGASIYDPDDGSEVANFGRIDSGGNPTVTIGPGDQPSTFSSDGIGLVGGAFRLTSERVTEEYGDENNPTTMTEIRSVMKSEGGNDDFETRCFLRSMVGEDDDAYYNSIELTSETDIKTQSPTETNNASVEVGSDQWGSSVRLVADSQELHLHKHPVNGKDYFDLHSEVFLITDYHNGVNMWSTTAGTVLWSGAYYMTSNHTANLAYNVSTCPTGIVLHFQPYSGSTTQNYFHQYCFVPKTAVSDYSGSVHNFTLCNSGFAKVGIKALRIYDNRIVGDDSNDDTGTASGITFDNKYWVMTQVIAV